MALNRELFFDMIRNDPFPGTLSQSQVDGITAIVRAWARHFINEDIRWLCYCLATTMHETASTMMPIEEYGKGSGMEYGDKDPETGQTYYGRGFVQLTWRDNYARADVECELNDEDLRVARRAGPGSADRRENYVRGHDPGLVQVRT